MRLQFVKDKREKYILFIIAFFTLALFFGCSSSSKTVKMEKEKGKSFSVDDSGGVEMRDTEPLEDLTTPLSENLGELDFDDVMDTSGLGEIPSLANEEDVLKERVIINVENTTLHDVIQSMIRGRGFNLILPEKLMGIVSAQFEDITLQDAFDQLLTAYGYTWHLDGNFLRIMKGEPIWIYKPKYIPISKTNEEISLGGRGQQGRIDSDLTSLMKELEIMKGPQGRFLINEWAGTITGIGLNPQVIPYLEEYLRVVDVKRKMVMLEATVIKVELEDGYKTGIDWGMIMDGESLGSEMAFMKGGRNLSASGWSDTFIKGFTAAGNGAMILANDHIKVVIQAFANQGKVNIMASSKALTVDGRSAFMRVEQEVAYLQSEVSYPGGGQSAFVTEKVQTKRPNLEFSVMPRVTDEGYINLNIFLNAEEVYSNLGGDNPVPLLSRREMNTNARAQNGQTVVIGGLIQETMNEQIKKVPFLGDIPLIGGMFRHTSQEKRKSEIVMFLTPHLVDDAKLNQFVDEDRLSIKGLQESDLKGHRPLFK